MAAIDRKSAATPTKDTSSFENEKLENATAYPNELVASEEAADNLRFVKSKAEKRLVLKQDLVIIPCLMLLYLMAFLDRGNMGNAKLMNFIPEALGGVDGNYAIASTVLYVGLVVWQIPGNALCKLVRPDIWIGGAAICWGICSTLQGAVSTPGAIYALRFLLGSFEAVFVPACPLYLSAWYTRSEIGVRVALWVSSSLSAGSFGGAIAYHVQTSSYSLSRWRVLFIAEGVPSIALGIFIILLMPSRPEISKFLNEDERVIAIERLNRTQKSEKPGTVDRSQLWAGFKDPVSWSGAVIYCCLNVIIGSVSSFLPSIVKGLGYVDEIAQLYTVPPYAVAFFILLVLNYGMDRFQTRGITIACLCLTSMIGYILLVAVETNLTARYFAIFCCLCANPAAISTIAWVTANAASESKRAIQIGILIGIGQTGGIIGSNIYPSSSAPRYVMGGTICATFAGVAAIIVLGMSVNFRLHNRKKDAKYGKPVPGRTIDLSEFEASPAWRFIV